MDDVINPNTIEILPKFMKFNSWKTCELRELGFTLIHVRIEGQGTMDGKPETETDTSWIIEIPYGDRIEELTIHERVTKRLYTKEIKGDIYDLLSEAIASRLTFFKIRITSMIIRNDSTDDIIKVRRVKNRMLVSHLNGLPYSDDSFNLDELGKALGDLYKVSCNLRAGSRRKPMICNPDSK